MNSRNRQLLLLALLIVAFVAVAGRQLLPGTFGGGGGATPGRSRTASGAVVEAGGPVEIAELRLDVLEHKPAVYEPGRDPFRFGVLPKPPPKPKPVRKERPVTVAKERRGRPPEPPRPQPPPVTFTFLGSFGLPGREIAVFTDGKEILNAFAGDVLQQEFLVRSIGYESADIGFVNFPDAPAKRLAVGG